MHVTAVGRNPPKALGGRTLGCISEPQQYGYESSACWSVRDGIKPVLPVVSRPTPWPARVYVFPCSRPIDPFDPIRWVVFQDSTHLFASASPLLGVLSHGGGTST